jgi:hypothetical protein
VVEEEKEERGMKLTVARASLSAAAGLEEEGEPEEEVETRRAHPTHDARR